MLNLLAALSTIAIASIEKTSSSKSFKSTFIKYIHTAESVHTGRIVSVKDIEEAVVKVGFDVIPKHHFPL